MKTQNIRQRFESALAGEAIKHPVYAVYDWFANNRHAVDWESLFEKGLGQINHANLVRHEHPNFKIVENQLGTGRRNSPRCSLGYRSG